MFIRATAEEYSDFRTPGIFYPYLEAMVTNGCVPLAPKIPIVFGAGVDIKVSAIGLANYSGPVDCVLRGWIEDDI
jgi:hypothetical protein